MLPIVDVSNCHLNFRVLLSEEKPKNIVTYTRRSISRDRLPNWSSIDDMLVELHISHTGRIENCEGALQVCFLYAYYFIFFNSKFCSCFIQINFTTISLFTLKNMKRNKIGTWSLKSVNYFNTLV